MNMTRWLIGLVLAATGALAEDLAVEKILTPPPPATPRINGPTVFGVRPYVPFLYTITATGVRPMKFAVENLPVGLNLDTNTGRITGKLGQDGEFKVTLKAENTKGKAEKKLRIVCGAKICLTPPLGWNSWNCWATAVDQDKVLRSARAMITSGLKDHGWSFINIDDSWQGVRGGLFGGIQGNEKFPDMKKLADEIHALGLKVGIYSTPWITSYAKFCGGSSENADGTWTGALRDQKFRKHGKYSFAVADAKQWAAWGFDYLKYDWNPNDLKHVKEMSDALTATGRDIVYSLSNSAPFANAGDLAQLANCWRTTGDIVDFWDHSDQGWGYSVSEIGFSQDRWEPFTGPGHWNDPDMLVVGHVGWGPQLHATHLTRDEQYAHISLWCLLSAPLLIGCDIEKLDAFTLSLLSNDEVLALDQDALGKQAMRVATLGPVDILLKELDDGGHALGFFNRGGQEYTAEFNKLSKLHLGGKQKVRDLWRQQDLPDTNGKLSVKVPAHGVVLLKLASTK